ncbi:NAD(+) diphosphatase, partial [Escherichia coli]
MEQQLKDDDTGWWVISREGKVWLPRGELPFGTAQQWQLSTKKA